MQYPDNQTNEQKLSQLMDGEWHELNPSECVVGLCEDDSLRAKWSRYHMIRDVMKNEPVAADQDLASRICAAIDDEPAYTNITPFNSASSVIPAAIAHSESSIEQAEEPAAVETRESARQSESADNNVTPIGEGKSASKSTSKNDSMFKTGLTGFALAASVALVTVVGMNMWQSQGAEQNPSIASATQNTSIDSASVAAQSVTDGTNTFLPQADGGALPVVEFVSNTGSYWVSPETTERVIDEQRLNMLLSQHIENSPTSDREGLLPYSRLVGYDERGLEQ